MKKSTVQIKYFSIKTLKELDQLAYKIAQIINKNDTICFDADLGMGKTTFCKFLVKHLGVTETVISPTFSIIQTYNCKLQNLSTSIHHIDLYRVSADELFELGIEEILNNGISLIEWSNKLESYMPCNCIHFHITEGINQKRDITIKYDKILNPNWTLLE